MSKNVAISIENISKTFKLPHERHASVKSALINFGKTKKGYENQKVLNNISFDIEEGEFFAIVGRNGSGKSTLLKLLAGIYTPSSGTIKVNGRLTPFIELGVGFNPELSGRENVYLNGALLGFSRQEIEAMYDDIVEFAELERFMDQKLKNYSSGMQVRLAFSIAIQAKSDILLLDEVLAVGDAAFQQKCFNYFEELKRKKQTVVFVSHAMDAVRRFCTKAAYIKDGDLIHLGTPSEVADIYLAENVKDMNAGKGPKQIVENYEITEKIVKQTKSELKIDIEYKSDSKKQMYIGISVFKDGFSIAEMVTSFQKPLKGTGVMSFTLNTSILNPGAYHIGAALFGLENRDLLSVCQKENRFLIAGEDITRAGPIKLEDTWEYR